MSELLLLSEVIPEDPLGNVYYMTVEVSPELTDPGPRDILDRELDTLRLRPLAVLVLDTVIQCERSELDPK